MYTQESRWSKEHINKTFEIIKRIKEQKPKHIRIFDKSIYWIILLLAIIGNIIISITAIFFLFVLKPLQLYPILILLGASFGLLIEILIRDIEDIKKRHHFIFLSIIPTLSLVSLFFITNVINQLRIANQFNPVIVAIVYSLSFVLPYVYYQFIRK